MLLTDLSLTHFRNHVNPIFRFGQKTIVIGPNGSGKTNILEAIRMMSVFKSFRYRKDRECIEFDHEVARIVAKGTKNSDLFKLELSITPAKKQVKLNEIKRTPTELFGWLPSILFSPADIALVYGSPSVRRRFLDSLLSQVDSKYLWMIVQYHRALKQRNSLLKDILYRHGLEAQLDIWDEQLGEFGEYINQKRSDLLQTISEQITSLYHQVSAAKETITIVSKLSQPSLDRIRSHRSLDLRFGSTSIGPHLDDFVILMDNRPINAYGSRGQWRSVVISLKKLEGERILAITQKKPVYLLDDVFSEFDHRHRELIIDLFGDSQIILTAVDQDLLGSIRNRLEVISIA